MHRTCGMTLVELLITLAIAAILATTALPAFSRWVDHYRIATGLQAMTRSLALARTEAVSRAGRVSMVNADNRWEEGWQIFFDRNGNGLFDSDEELLQQQQSSPGLRIRGNHHVQNRVTYRADGRSILPSGAFLAGTFLICPQTVGPAPYKLIIAKGGRVRSERLVPGAAECK